MFIKIQDIKIHYKISGNGPPVVLLHGWGKDLESLKCIQQPLSKRFSVYSVDLPGFGLSSVPSEPCGTKEYAEIITKLIKQLKITKPILIGHSFGGKIIISLIARKLINAEKLVLISSAGVLAKNRFITKLKVYFFKIIKFLALLPIIKNIFSSFFRSYRKKLGSTDYNKSSGVMRSILIKVVNENMASLLRQIKFPTLLIWGSADRITPLSSGKIMNKLINNSRLKIIQTGGHFPFIDDYQSVIKEIEEFL